MCRRKTLPGEKNRVDGLDRMATHEIGVAVKDWAVFMV
jgi:hypothetical protein